MKTYNVRSKQWRRHYRKIRRLNEPGGKINATITDGIIRHDNKMLLNGRQFWIPINP